MNKILVPTDFSEYAHKALDYAVMLAKKVNAEVILHHGFALPDLPAGSIGGLEKMRRVETNYCKEKLQELAGSYAGDVYEHTGEPVQIRPLLTDGGSTVVVIADIVKDEGVELVVMGTKGAHGLEKLFVGSVTVEVADRVACPVLAIPAKSYVTPIHRLVYATQFDPADSPLIHRLHNFADKIDAELTCLHIQKDAKERLSEEFTKSLELEGLSLEIRVNQSSTSGIREFVENEKPDILVMLTHERSFFEGLFNKSITHEIAYAATTPVLIFKASK